MRLRCQLFGFACLAMLIAAPLSTAQAVPTNYTYTGNPYTSVIGSEYTTSMFITTTITLSSALGANLVDFDALSLVTTFTVFDGVQTFTPANLNPLFFAEFRFNTDGLGAIERWAVIYTPLGFREIATCNDPGLSGLISASLAGCLTPWETLLIPARDRASSDFGEQGQTNSPGVWTSSAVPEPSTSLLVALGLVGLASSRRRARQ